jgi:hypothetical protein
VIFFTFLKGELKMPVDENNEQSGTESNDKDTSGQGTKEDGIRIGTKEDAREVSGEEGASTPEPRDNLRDGN